MEHFVLKPLDVKKFIKGRELKEITNPIFFNKLNSPTSDGLLSNEIFGITKVDRAETFAYISLQNEVFINPLMYTIWKTLDNKIPNIVHGIKNYRIDSKGNFVEDEEGDTGIPFLYKNMDKIKFKHSDSNSRQMYIKFLNEYKKFLYIKEMIVIPAYYRDVLTGKSRVGVGDLNKLYNALIVSTRSLKESSEYGLTVANSLRGRIQGIICQIYQWLANDSNVETGVIKGLKSGSGMAKKKGILRRAVLSKTPAYSSRLVLSSPDNCVETMADMQVDLDHAALPLAAAIVNLKPFILYYIRKFFDRELGASPYYEYINPKGKLERITLKNYLIEFSDERILKEMDRFVHGFSNRFIDIPLPNKEGKRVRLKFKGSLVPKTDVDKYRGDNIKDYNDLPIVDRPMTWCDLFYIAAVECSSDKCALITRFPIDSYFNQFPIKVRVMSTLETEPMIIMGELYEHYPKIRKEDIGSNTSNKFKDTLNICNLYLDSIGGDYDGDQTTCKIAFTEEANAELVKELYSNKHYIGLDCMNVMFVGTECVQALYNLTLVLPDTKVTTPTFKHFKGGL